MITCINDPRWRLIHLGFWHIYIEHIFSYLRKGNLSLFILHHLLRLDDQNQGV
jgi:hypothetical protein